MAFKMAFKINGKPPLQQTKAVEGVFMYSVGLEPTTGRL